MPALGELLVQRQASANRRGLHAPFTAPKRLHRWNQLHAIGQVVGPPGLQPPPRAVPASHPRPTELMARPDAQAVVAHLGPPFQGRGPSPRRGPTALWRPVPSRAPCSVDRPPRQPIERSSQPKVHNAFAPAQGSRRRSELSGCRPRPIMGQVLACGQRHPRLRALTPAAKRRERRQSQRQSTHHEGRGAQRSEVFENAQGVQRHCLVGGRNGDVLHHRHVARGGHP